MKSDNTIESFDGSSPTQKFLNILVDVYTRNARRKIQLEINGEVNHNIQMNLTDQNP